MYRHVSVLLFTDRRHKTLYAGQASSRGRNRCSRVWFNKEGNALYLSFINALTNQRWAGGEEAESFIW